LFKVDVSFLTFVFFIFYTESVDVKILPYDDVSQFYEEYVVDCDASHVPKHERAGKTTFSAAYTKLHETGKYRILGGKGSFKTCEICNNTYALLRDPQRRFTKAQRDVLSKFKTRHRHQQEAERLHLKRMKDLVRSSIVDGKPTI